MQIGREGSTSGDSERTRWGGMKGMSETKDLGYPKHEKNVTETEHSPENG